MKKRSLSLFLAIWFCTLTMTSCSTAEVPADDSGTAAENAASMLYQQQPATDGKIPADGSAETKINVSFNGHTYPAALADNTSAEAFAELLKNGSLTVSTHDYGGFEKVGDLETTLPRNDEQITTAAGDIILYQGNQITVYYAENSWSLTRLGRIDDPSGLQDALGSGDVTITFSLAGENPGGFDLTALLPRK